VQLPLENVTFALTKTLVVVLTFTLIGRAVKPSDPNAVVFVVNETNDTSGSVADDVLIQANAPVKTAALGKYVIIPHTSQSPAVSAKLVKFVGELLDIPTGDPEAILLLIYSPTSPAAALLTNIVPIIPPVEGLKARDVAVAAPRVGVTNTGDVAPTKLPVPVEPDKGTLTALFVAIVKILLNYS
jgi:hypothetical protein